MEREELRKNVLEIKEYIRNKGLNFICYIWDDNSGMGGGTNSPGTEFEDSLVAIKRIVQQFDIDPKSLFIALLQACAWQERN